jgi:hypothetical protein
MGRNRKVKIMTRAILAAALCLPAFAQSWQPLPKPDLSKIKLESFTDQELDLPFYLAHFHELAGAVVENGPDRGFIAISVWRRPQDNKPYNARIMENLTSLAWFYATKRPWNLYYASPALRQRLEAALDFWRRAQAPDGQFSEYGPQKWNLAATAFATKFMGETLRLLKSGPPLDAALLKSVVEADRKAIRVLLTSDTLYRHGKTYSNQFTNLWPGALAFFKLYPDPELERRFAEVFERSLPDFQSPAGFFYEADGPDWGYNSGTHQSNLRGAYHYTRGADMAKSILEHERHWFEWLAWNAVPETRYSGWMLNRAIETRQRRGYFEELATPLAEQVELARAFAPTEAQLRPRLDEARRELRRQWPEVKPLETGRFEAWSPYVFLHRSHYDWRPSAPQQFDARRALPYIARDRFAHQAMDSRNPMVYTYVRRRGYYAAFNSGKHLRDQQRYGLGLLWNPYAFTLLQSQSGSDTAAWGTLAQGAKRVYEAGDLTASFAIDGKPLSPAPGARDLPEGELTIRYSLGDKGEKFVRFADEAIEVTVRHPGPFSEILPLLAEPGKQVIVDRAEVRIGPLKVTFGAGVAADSRLLDDEVGPKQLTLVRLHVEGQLQYRLELR